jgi:hypothetical protein
LASHRSAAEPLEVPINVESPENELPPQPRLQIIHLLLWTAGTAVVLATWREHFAGSDSRSAAQVLAMVGFLLQAPLAGAAVASLGVWAYRARKGRRFPVQPGEWMLVVHGVTALAWAVVLMLTRILFETPIRLDGATTLTFFWLLAASCVYLICVFLIEAGLYLTAAIRVRTAPAWRLFLACQGLRAFVNASRWASNGLDTAFDLPELILLERFAAMAANATVCVCLVMLIIAVVRDWRRRTPRGWMHWVGVVTALVTTLISIAWIVVLRLA